MEFVLPLIDCPDCRKEISDRAPACIHCGCPIDLENTVSKNGPSPAVEKKEEFKEGIIVQISLSDEYWWRYKIRDKEGISYLANEEVNILNTNIEKNLKENDFVLFDPNLENGVVSRMSIPSDFSNLVLSDFTKNTGAYGTDAVHQLSENKITKNYLWYLVLLIIAAVYWIAKGAPNPALFFTGNTAKEECLRLANENKAKLFFFNGNEITANDTWLKDGKRVVQMLQKDEDGMRQIMCLYGNGMVQIPSALEQGRWR